MEYVGIWKRLLAYMLDMIPIFLLVFGVAYFFLGFDEVLSTYFKSVDSGGDVESRIAFLSERNKVRDASFLLWLLYGQFMDRSKFQGTHGKIILRIKVTDIEGNRITFKQSSSRTAMKVVGAIPLFLGYIWAAFRKDKAAWHDLTASTRVVKR